MPEKFIITKENKEKVEKFKYKDYENYIQTTYKKIDERLITGNIISNENKWWCYDFSITNRPNLRSAS